MKNARHWEIYSVMNSPNNAFMATDKYPYKKAKLHMLEPNQTSKETKLNKNFFFSLAHMCCKYKCWEVTTKK